MEVGLTHTAMTNNGQLGSERLSSFSRPSQFAFQFDLIKRPQDMTLCERRFERLAGDARQLNRFANGKSAAGIETKRQFLGQFGRDLLPGYTHGRHEFVGNFKCQPHARKLGHEPAGEQAASTGPRR